MKMEMGKERTAERTYLDLVSWQRQCTCVSQAKNLIKQHRVPSRMLRFHYMHLSPSARELFFFYSGIKLFWLSLIISAFSLCLLWFFCFPSRNANQITRNVCVCVCVESLSSFPLLGQVYYPRQLKRFSAMIRRHLEPIYAMACSAVSKIICLTIKDDKH